MTTSKTIIIALAATLMPMTAVAQRLLTVDELFRLVETGSKTLKAQKAGVDVASRAVEQAKSQRLPDISVQAAVSYNGNVIMADRDLSNWSGFSGPHVGNSFALEARQTVYAGGAHTAGVQLAELQRERELAATQRTRNGERLMALGRYLDLYKTDNSLRVYERNIALTERLMADIRAKEAQGMALKNDVTRYGLQLETLRLGRRKAQDLRDVTNYRLCHTLGLEQTEITPDSNVTTTPITAATEDEWQQRAVAKSPALRMGDLNVKMAEQQLRMAKSSLRPKLFVVAADNFNGPFTYDVPPIDKNFNVWYVGVGLSYQLSSLFKSNKDVRRASAALAQSQEERDATAETVANDTREAYTLFRQSFVELRTRRKNVELARQNYDVVRERYLNQLSLITDMIDASNVLLDAELQEVDARINIVYAYYNIKYVSGEI